MRQRPCAPLSTCAAALACLLVASPSFANGSITGTVSAKQAKLRKNAVVYIERGKRDTYPPLPTAHVGQERQEFIPFVTPVVRGTTVLFSNSDNTGHNVFTPDGEKFDAGVFNKGETYTYTFKAEGVYTLLCKLHPSMISYVVVLQNPHFAVTADDGSFRIDDVPAGDYTVKLWHERKVADPQRLQVTDGGTSIATFELRK
ncbi:MAG: hypothetical protein HY903_07765 [Deltaproteobacteria bacterium]|nr:hypothetical protein [Deltaproteobacteria bacterium]